MGAPRERRRIDPELLPGPGVAFGDPQVLAGNRLSIPQELHVGRASRELLAFVALVGEHLIPPLHDVEVDSPGEGRAAGARDAVFGAADPVAEGETVLDRLHAVEGAD